MKKKARIFFLFLMSLVLSMTAGCSRFDHALSIEEADDDRLKVVTTLFPYYDFVRQIAGDKVNLIMVVPAGMDSHSFEPTPADMITIQNADLLICNGGVMETWLSQVLDSLDASRMTVLTMMDYVDTVEEEIVEGMEAEGDHDHGDGNSHDHGVQEDHDHSGEMEYGDEVSADDGHGEEIEYDEHIWTAPANAIILTEVIGLALGEADPANRDYYEERTDAYVRQLEALDQEFRQVVAGGGRKMMIFGDKFPFRYFADEFGLEYRAAFSGCSSDTEPSAKTIAYLIDKVRDERIPAVYYLELSSHRVSEIIGEETGARPLLFHSCHNVTRREFDSGITYLELMERNVINLRKGLQE